MGEKRTSVRTLPSGEKVVHRPDGTMELIRGRSPLREKLAATRMEKKRRHGVIHARHLQRVEVKRLRQRAKGLPPEKSVV
jgi:hypothetical protein